MGLNLNLSKDRGMDVKKGDPNLGEEKTNDGVLLKRSKRKGKMNSLDRVLIANERWNSHMQENGPEDSHHGGISQESFLDVNRVLQRWHEANKLYESYSAGTSIDDDPTPTTTTDEICTEEEFREAVKLTKIYVDRYLHQKSDFPNVEGLFRRIEATTDLISTRCGVYVVRTKRV